MSRASRLLPIQNGDFESGASGWSLTGPAAVTGAYGAKNGSLALKLQTDSGFLDRQSFADHDGAFNLLEGMVYTVDLWVKLDRAEYPYSLSVLFDRGLGAFEHLAIISTASHVIGTWVSYRLQTVAAGSVGRLRFASGTPAPAAVATTRWVVDVVRLWGPVITTTLRQALVADLAAVDGTGSFFTTLAVVASEPEASAAQIYPAVYIVPGGGSTDDIDERTNLTGVATQEWNLRLLVLSATPHEDIEKLLDDVRLAVGRLSGNLQNVSGVHYAGVTQWPDEVRTSAAGHQQLGEIECTVEARYEYDRNTV